MWNIFQLIYFLFINSFYDIFFVLHIYTYVVCIFENFQRLLYLYTPPPACFFFIHPVLPGRIFNSWRAQPRFCRTSLTFFASLKAAPPRLPVHLPLINPASIFTPALGLTGMAACRRSGSATWLHYDRHTLCNSICL